MKVSFLITERVQRELAAKGENAARRGELIVYSAKYAEIVRDRSLSEISADGEVTLDLMYPVVNGRRNLMRRMEYDFPVGPDNLEAAISAWRGACRELEENGTSVQPGGGGGVTTLVLECRALEGVME